VSGVGVVVHDGAPGVRILGVAKVELAALALVGSVGVWSRVVLLLVVVWDLILATV